MSIDRAFWKTTPEEQAAAQALRQAAQANDAAGILQNLGKTGVTGATNAEALRIAAEAKNYEAFEAILDASRKGGMLPSAPTTLPHTQDWVKAKAIASDDSRLSMALTNYLKAKQDVISMAQKAAPAP